ncbi:MAG: DUF4147 domain-containing protein, partial [Deltaproteobacteria bacterium]|nr:DUF4147 domain-containing protein [Deltaproteobacteria bacterium]
KRMAEAVEKSLLDLIDFGAVITGHQYSKPLEKMRVLEAGHPLPDESGIAATKELMNIISGVDNKTMVLFLLSGGASAMLVSPVEEITLEDKVKTTDILLRCGADITEINRVRKKLSLVKGGGFLKKARPAFVETLILSDVAGDRIDIIGSAPTVPESSDFNYALMVLSKYDIVEKTPGRVLNYLRKMRAAGTGPKGESFHADFHAAVIGNNKTAGKGAEIAAAAMGFKTEVSSREVNGEARKEGEMLAAYAIARKSEIRENEKICVISGGETTVKVKGTGRGGRNMELALSFALRMEGEKGVTLLSAGTDGFDGPTGAAGATADGETAKIARMAGANPVEFLENNDSYGFFEKFGGLLMTGATGTNVRDIQIMIIEGDEKSDNFH